MIYFWGFFIIMKTKDSCNVCIGMPLNTTRTAHLSTLKPISLQNGMARIILNTFRYKNIWRVHRCGAGASSPATAGHGPGRRSEGRGADCRTPSGRNSRAPSRERVPRLALRGGFSPTSKPSFQGSFQSELHQNSYLSNNLSIKIVTYQISYLSNQLSIKLVIYHSSCLPGREKFCS